ncbi:MAG TPA: hypothetical protein ENN51_05485 [candidate division WOR-3 bacterium]|uniref:Uncharacterized protein n=1 Tax=candidate division WOR-3 bacterium TaxID=2052148 RepID=A0A7V0T688_UNCW3|nr:hypothetical protein [candidate division WOR-3 bacterium]
MKGYQLVLAFVAFVLVGVFCLRPPELPQWDTTVNVPLYAGTFRLGDLLDSSRFRANPDSTIQFSWSDSIGRVSADGVVDIIEVSENSTIGLADLLIVGLPVADGGRGLDELLGRPLPDSGAKMTIPPFTVTVDCSLELPDVEFAEVASGLLDVTVRNYTGLPFDSVTLVLPFARVAFGAVVAGGSVGRRLPLGGCHVRSPVTAQLVVASPGAGDTIVFAKGDSLRVELGLDSLTLVSGRVRLPEVSGGRFCRVGLATSKPFRIDSIAVKDGRCRVRLRNSFSVPVAARLLVPQLGRDHRRELPAKGETTIEVDLAGCEAGNRSRTNCLLEFEVVAEPLSAGEFLDLTKQDRLTIDWLTEELGLAYVAGEFQRPVYIASRLETLPPILPPGVRGVRIPEADVVLDLESGIGFPLELLVDLVAHGDGRELRREQRTLYLPPARDEGPSRTTHVLPVENLINTGPELVTLEYHTRILGQGRYDAGAGLKGRATMSTPMRLAFEDDTVAGPARPVTLSAEHRRLIARHLVEAEVTVRVSNHLPAPFAGWLRLAPAPVDSGARPDLTPGHGAGRYRLRDGDPGRAP